MKKVAYYLNNASLEGVNCLNIIDGNPGIGGSEYMILLIAFYNSIGDNGIDITLFVQKNYSLPSTIKIIETTNLKSAIIECDKLNIEILIFRHDNIWFKDGTFKAPPEKVKLIPWCHNFVDSKFLSFYSKHDYFIKIINVGKEQLEMYIDHSAYRKSDYIFNGISLLPYKKLRLELPPFEKRNNIVTYIGSLIPSKGFHLLAKVWTKILDGCPDAQLYVIGSGKLYDRSATLGKFGIAEASYESEFLKYLLVEGNLLPSVHFLGVLGAEKNEVLKNTKVGIPNPSGFTETFGITALEFQIMGAKVVTIRCPGYLDTVYDKNFLYDNPNQLCEFVLKALNLKDYNDNETFYWISQNFNIERIASQWSDLLINKIPNNGWLHSDRFVYQNIDFRNKKLKIILSNCKKNVPVLYWLPAVETIKSKIIDKIKRRFQ